MPTILVASARVVGRSTDGAHAIQAIVGARTRSIKVICITFNLVLASQRSLVFQQFGLNKFLLLPSPCHPLFAGRVLLAAVQADWRSAAGVKNCYSLAPQVLGELPQGFACPAGGTHRHARLV